MNEMERRSLNEALQNAHRQDWLKQAGIRPLDTKPLPQLISEKNSEVKVEPVAVEEKKSYEIQIPEAAERDLSFVFDTYSQQAMQEPLQYDTVSTQPPPDPSASIQEYTPAAAQEDGGQSESPTYSVAPEPENIQPQAPEEQKQQEDRQEKIEQPQPAEARVESPEAKTKPEAQPSKDDLPPALQDQKRPQEQPQEHTQPTQTSEVKHDEPDKNKRQDKKPADSSFNDFVADSRKEIREQAKAEMQQSRMKAAQKMMGNGFPAMDFGGILQGTVVGNDPNETGRAYQALADSGGAFAATAAEAILRLAKELAAATQRIRLIEQTLDDGAS